MLRRKQIGKQVKDRHRNQGGDDWNLPHARDTDQLAKPHDCEEDYGLTHQTASDITQSSAPTLHECFRTRDVAFVVANRAEPLVALTKRNMLRKHRQTNLHLIERNTNNQPGDEVPAFVQSNNAEDGYEAADKDRDSRAHSILFQYGFGLLRLLRLKRYSGEG